MTTTTIHDHGTAGRNDGFAADKSAAGAAITRWLLGGVAFAAGVVGVAMLVAPGSTGRYFSWQLNPPALAALVGACYVASALIFGLAAWRKQWSGQRGLCVAVLGLAGPTLVATVRHRAVFDFDRRQAVAWVVLFVASVTSFTAVVVARPRPAPSDGPRLARGARTALVGLGGAYAVGAAVLWSSPFAVSDHGPLAAGPLGLRFIGSWSAFLSISAFYASTHSRREEAGLPVAALVAFPLAMLGAALAHLDAFRSGGNTAAFVTSLALLTAAGSVVAIAGRRTWIRPMT